MLFLSEILNVQTHSPQSGHNTCFLVIFANIPLGNKAASAQGKGSFAGFSIPKAGGIDMPGSASGMAAPAPFTVDPALPHRGKDQAFGAI